MFCSIFVTIIIHNIVLVSKLNRLNGILASLALKEVCFMIECTNIRALLKYGVLVRIPGVGFWISFCGNVQMFCSVRN